MAARYKTVEREQLMLLPPDLREWVPAGDIVHFIIEAAELVSMESFKVNDRGSGEPQYHPPRMLALLLYCYSHGIFTLTMLHKSLRYDRAIQLEKQLEMEIQDLIGQAKIADSEGIGKDDDQDPPAASPKPEVQVNLTDSESRIMRNVVPVTSKLTMPKRW